MTVRVIHAKVSGKAAGTDTTRVYGNHWDADHTVTGLENVDNTSDANKPVSTAQAAADALKANLSGGNSFTGHQQIATTNVGSNVAVNSGTRLTVNANTAAPPATSLPSLEKWVAQIMGEDGKVAGLVMNGFGTNAFPAIGLFSARGTGAAPTALASGDVIGVIDGHSYGGEDANGYTVGGSPQLRMVTTQNVTASNQGTAVAIWTTPNNTTANAGVREVARFDQSGFLGINTTTPKTLMDANANASGASPALINSSSLGRYQAADGSVSAFEVVSYGSAGVSWVGGAAGGTAASPTASPNGTSLTNFGGYGHNGTSFQLGGAMVISAGSLWSGTNQETNVQFYVTPLNTTAYVLGAKVNSSGGFSVGAAAADPGANVINVTTGYRVANAATSGNVLRGNGTNFVSSQLAFSDLSGSVSAIHTWALTQTFTVAPVFTDQSGSRTALGLGTAATQNTGTSGANVPLLNGTNIFSGNTSISASGVAPDSPLTVNANTGSTVAVLAGTNAHFVGADAANNFAYFDAFGGQPAFIMRRANGTLGSKTALALNDIIFNFSGQGWDTSGYFSSAAIAFRAAEAWTTIAHGTYINLTTVAIGSTTASVNARLNPSGGLTLGSGLVGTDPGSGSINLSGSATLGSFTVAALPAGSAGMMVFCSNCRMFNGAGVQEGAGSGTGGMVSYNGSAWKIVGTNVTAVA